MADYTGKGVWCVAEARRGKLSPTIFELLTAGRKIADARGEEVVAVLIGADGVTEMADEVAARGADKVLVLKDEKLKSFVDDAYAAALSDAAKSSQPRTILLPASVSGRALAPRRAVSLGAGLVSDALDLEIDDQKRLVAERSCYAGNVVAKIAVKTNPEMATVRPLAFSRSAPSDKKAAIENVSLDASSWVSQTEFVRYTPEKSDEIDMSAAEKIVSGGRGLGNQEGFDVIRELAKTLGAAVGASRAAVDAGWIPYKNQVGLTGRSVRPRLYFACGISGQIQHLAGMNSSDTIVAINSDPDCPMMKLATYAVQGDLYKVIPALIAEIQKARGGDSSSNGSGG